MTLPRRDKLPGCQHTITERPGHLVDSLFAVDSQKQSVTPIGKRNLSCGPAHGAAHRVRGTSGLGSVRGSAKFSGAATRCPMEAGLA